MGFGIYQGFAEKGDTESDRIYFIFQGKTKYAFSFFFCAESRVTIWSIVYVAGDKGLPSFLSSSSPPSLYCTQEKEGRAVLRKKEDSFFFSFSGAADVMAAAKVDLQLRAEAIPRKKRIRNFFIYTAKGKFSLSFSAPKQKRQRRYMWHLIGEVS